MSEYNNGSNNENGKDILSIDEQAEFTESGFWDKVKAVALNAGRAVIERALLLYYVASDNSTPLWIRTALYSALAYFILPIDAVPDAVPLVGFGDDMAAMAAALTLAEAYVTEEHREEAGKTLKRWFD